MELLLSPANLLAEIARSVERFRLPGLDAGALLEGRRKDIEALAEANRITLGGAQELAQKQGEILQETLRGMQALVQEGTASIVQDPTKIGKVVQRTWQETFGNMRDLAELSRKSQTEAFRVVGERMQGHVEELSASLLPFKAKKSLSDKEA